jgi:hypothetical protein
MMGLRSAVAAAILSISSLLSILSLPRLADATAPSDADNAYLDRLLGQWDMTGSMGSKTLHYHARGERDGDRLVMIFPYVEGAFRDTFVFMPEGGWSLLLESQKPNGTWSTFASYTLTHSP